MNRIILTRFKDNTYWWNLMKDETPVMYNAMLSKGMWLYNIPLTEITRAVTMMNETKDNVAVFDNRHFVCTRNTLTDL